MKTLLSRSMTAVTAAAAIVLAPVVTGAATAYADEPSGPAPVFYDTCREPAQLKIPAGGTFTKDGQTIAAGLHEVQAGATVNIAEGSRQWTFTNTATECPQALAVTQNSLENHTGSILPGVVLYDYSAQVTPGSGGSDNGPASHLFDGNNGTFWHTPYSGLTERDRRLPHWATADLGEPKQVDFVEITSRPVANGHPDQVSILSSEDGQTFQVVAEAQVQKAQGNAHKFVTVKIPQTTARYFALLVHTSHDQAKYVNLSEIRFGSTAPVEVTPKAPNFLDLGASNAVEIPFVKGVQYALNGENKEPGFYTLADAQTASVTATAKEHYVLASGATATWTSAEFAASTCAAGTINQPTGAKLTTGASVVEWDTESFGGRGGEDDAKAIYATDGNVDKLWHTPYTNAGGVRPHELKFPHGLEIDLGETHQPVDAVKYFHRGVRTDAPQGNPGSIKTVEVLSSNDGLNFVSRGCFSVPNLKMVNHPASAVLNLPAPVTDRFLRLHITEAHETTSYLTVNELEFYAPNQAPDIDAEGLSVRVGAQVNIPVTATDPEGDQTTIEVAGQPDWLDFADGAITGTAPNTAQQHELTITARDAHGKEATKKITVIVVANAVPTVVLEPATLERFQGEDVSSTITSNDTDGTVTDGPSLANGSPNWLSVAGGKVTGTVPTDQAAGAVEATVEVTDNDGAKGTAKLTITVKENHAPTIEAQDASVRVGDEVSIPVEITDPEGHTFDVVVEGLPGGLTFANNKISGTAPAEAGVHEVTIKVTDQYGKIGTKQITLTVSANVAPTLSLAQESVTVFVGQTVSVLATVEDSDGDQVSLSLEDKPEWLSLDDKTVSGTPTAATTDPVVVKVKAVDGHGGETVKTLTITVKENHAPTIEAQDASVRVGDEVSIPVEITDPEGHTFDVVVEGLPGGLTFANNKISGTAPAEAGVHEVTIKVTDQYGKIGTKQITLTVSANVAPTLSLAQESVTVFVGQTVSVLATVEDSDGDQVSLSLEDKPEWLSLDDKTVSGTPTAATTDPVVVKVKAVDGHGGETVKTLTITVKENHAPTFGELTGLEPIRVGESLDVTIPVMDIDNHTVKVTLKAGTPDWLTINEKGHMVGTAPAGSVGTIPVSVLATDDLGLTAEKQINVVVRANVAPTLSLAQESVTVFVGQTVSVLATVEDSDGDQVSLSLEDKPEWLSLDDKTVSGTPTAAATDPVVVKVKAVDGHGGETVKTLTITVKENQAPTVNLEPVAVNARVGAEVSVVVTTSDQDGHTVTVELLDAPAWLTYSADTKKITGTAEAGTHTVRVKATDALGKATTVDLPVTITVAPANEVRPYAPLFVDLAGAGGKVVIPDTEGVEYLLGEEVKAPGEYAVEDGLATVTVRPKDGYTLAPDVPSSWEHTFASAACVAGKLNGGRGPAYEADSVVDYDTQSVNGIGGETNGGADNVIDGNPATFWHTPWKKNEGVSDSEMKFPHFVEVDLGESRELGAVELTYRKKTSGAPAGFNGQPKQVELLTSVDGQIYVSAGCFTLPDMRASNNPVVTMTLASPVQAQYVRVHVSSTHTNDNMQYTAISELKFFGPNRAPAFSEITVPASVREGGSVDIAVPVLDPDNDSVAITLKDEEPAWLRIADGKLVGTVPTGSAGKLSVTLVATDAHGAVTEKTIELNITANVAPTLSLAQESVTVFVGQTVSVLATVEDSDGDQVSLSLEDKPEWLSLDDKTVSGTPTAAATDPVVVKVKAVDGHGGETVKTLTITVKENHAPTIEAQDASVRVGDEVSIPVEITDPEGHTFDVVVEGLPGGLTFANNKISGTAPAEAGVHEVTIKVTDQYGKIGTKQITLTVSANVAPTLSLAQESVTVFVGQTVSVLATVEDSDGDQVSLSLEDKPEWLSLDDKTVSGTPTAATTDPVVVKVKAVDGHGGETVKTLTITVKENHAPTVNLEPVAVNARVGAEVSVVVTTSDQDGHTVTVELLDAPAWLTYSADTKKITGTAEAGTHTVRVKATDALGKATTVDLLVTITAAGVPATAKAPVFVDLAGAGGKVVIPAVEGLQYKIGGKDVAPGESVVPDGEAVVTVVAKDGFVLAPGTAKWSHTFVSAACVAGAVNGGRGESYASGTLVDFDTQSINGVGGEANGYARHVVDGNPATFWHTPWKKTDGVTDSEMKMPHHVTIDLGQARNLGAVELTHRAKTPETTNGYGGQPKSVELLTSVDGATFTSAGCFTLPDLKTEANPVVTMTLAKAVNAKFVRVQVTEAHHSKGFTLINELKFFGPNRAPVFGEVAAEVNVNEGANVELALPATDPDKDTVKLSLAEGHPAWLRIADGKLVGTAPAGSMGEHVVTIVATDDHGASVTKKVTVKVAKPANQAPTVKLSKDAVDAVAGQKLPEVVVTATDPDQGDEVKLSLVGTPRWVKLDGNKITGDVPAGASGNLVITVKATDKAGASATALLRVKVAKPANTPPTVSVNPNKVEIREEGKVDVAITAADADAGDKVTLTVADTPAWLKLDGTKLVGTAPIGSGGKYTVTVTATDTRGAKTTAQVQITVDANDAPVLTVKPDQAVVNEGEDVSFTVTATDAENDAITFALQGAPSWLSLKESQVSGTAPTISAGEFRFTVVATDALGARTTKDVKLTVKESKKLDRYSGADRIATSVDVWQRAGFTSKTVLLANATTFADAVAAGPLAAALDAPVVLTSGKILEPKTAAALKATGITKVVLIGGENSVSAQVERSLRVQGIATTRLGGANRFATAINVATEVGKLTATRSVMVVDGTNYADGLTAGAVAPKVGAVVVYSDSKTMPKETRVFLQQMIDKNIYGVGGAGAAALNSSGWTTGVNATAVTGADRYATALALAKMFAPDTREIVIASGANFADALSAGALAADRGGALLLTRSTLLPVEVEQYLRKQNMHRIAIVGGPVSISSAVERSLRALLG